MPDMQDVATKMSQRLLVLGNSSPKGISHEPTNPPISCIWSVVAMLVHSETRDCRGRESLERAEGG